MSDKYPDARQKERHNFYKHGGYGTRLYNIWRLMRQRTNSPKCKDYPSYGGRGIQMCIEWWDSFPAFKEWADAHGYNDTLTVDRIDVDGDYSPENCRIATRKEQNQNKRKTRKVSVDGEPVALSEVARKNGLKTETLNTRINRLGWSVDKATSTPVQTSQKKSKPSRNSQIS